MKNRKIMEVEIERGIGIGTEIETDTKEMIEITIEIGVIEVIEVIGVIGVIGTTGEILRGALKLMTLPPLLCYETCQKTSLRLW